MASALCCYLYKDHWNVLSILLKHVINCEKKDCSNNMKEYYDIDIWQNLVLPGFMNNVSVMMPVQITLSSVVYYVHLNLSFYHRFSVRCR